MTRSWTPVVAVASIVVVVVVLVALTLRQPDVAMFAPTQPAPKDAGKSLVGPVLYTVDATASDRWQYFSLRVGAVVANPGPVDWDLAFRRYQIIANGGPAFIGQGGIRDLGAAGFDAVQTVPADGYAVTEGKDDPKNPAVASWYDYGFFSHVLKPKPHVWAVRTADGRYAKVEFVGYYCPGSRPGCLTLRYVFQGNGSTAVASARTAALGYRP
jgi:hypothetical protein